MIKIYGASDDLIEIEGSITDEHNDYAGASDRGISFSCSDETEGRITYDDPGEWKIRVDFAGSAYINKIESVGDSANHTEPDAVGCSSYSDVLILHDVDWIKIGRKKYYA